MEKTLAWDKKHWPIVVVGPTATGKTAAAIALAEQINGEIVNADSMQVYSGMDIGTAKPDANQRRRVPFHLLDIVSPDQPFTVSQWKRLAEESIQDIFARGRHPILCGGTGLYVRALLDDWSLAATPANPLIRERLQTEVDERGAAELYNRLQAIDPITAARLHPNDALRIIRALEVFLVTGTPISTYQEQDRQGRMPRQAHRFGLRLPRALLYERIDQRVDDMLNAGLESEVKALMAGGFSSALSPMRSLGYKEMTAFLAGRQSYDSAVSDIKQNTRRYAKRQETWFRADPLIYWLDTAALTPAQASCAITTKLADFLI